MTTAKEMTVTEFKRWMACEAGELTDALMVAMAFAQVERERVDAYVEPIFATFGFRNKRTGELLPKSSLLYLADDDRLAVFYAACDAAHREHGFTGPAGMCPALVAEHEVIKAEWLLIEAASGAFGFDAGAVYGEKRKRLLDILLGANAIKYRK